MRHSTRPYFIWTRAFALSIALLMLLPALLATPVAAATTVMNCNDNGTGSLRAALAAGGTITFAMDCPATGPILLTSGSLAVNTNLTTVDGTGHTIVVDGNGAVTVFVVGNSVTASLNNLTIQHGSANLFSSGTDKSGGGIYNLGFLTLTNTIVTNNQANSGGGIYNALSLTLTNSTVSNNTVGGPNPNAAYPGGGIRDNCAFGASVRLNGSTISGNTASVGGGIFTACSDLRIANSTISGNHAVTSLTGVGGGIYCSACNLTVTGSTVSGNMADLNVGGILLTDGGMTMTNSTVSGNTAVTQAGGIELFQATQPTSFRLIQTTISGNSAGTDQSGIFINSSAHPTIQNSIIDNTCAGPGTVSSAGYNIDATGTCHLTATGDRAINPMLGMLANNGGPTKTHLPGSPAIDQIPNTGGCNGANVTTDQRGFTRPQPVGGLCDIGAVEIMPPPTISLLRPASGPTTGNAVSVIFGTGFQTGLTVTFDGAPATIVAMNSVAIRVLTPAHPASGPVTVVVTNPDGQAATATNAYTYGTVNPLPVPQPTAPVQGGAPTVLPPARPTGAPINTQPSPLPPRRSG